MPDPTPVPQPDDWTVAVADRIESLVGAVRDRTTVPIVKVARIVVFGVLAGIAGMVALVLLFVAAVRLHVYLPFHPEGRQVYVTYAALSGLLLLAGSVAWHKRAPRER